MNIAVSCVEIKISK